MIELADLAVRTDVDVPQARQAARVAARLLGLGQQDRTRIATAVSELARAISSHGGGLLTLSIDGDEAGQWLVATGSVPGGSLLAAPPGSDPDTDPGVLRHAGRLVDRFVETVDGLQLTKRLPASGPVSEEEGARLRAAIAAEPLDTLEALRSQNRELVETLVLLREREGDLLQLNEELAETNRGVVALYGELEGSAERVRLAQRQVFTELEAALRPPPPEVPGFELAVRYLPAQSNSPTGGDLYDWLPLSDGTLHIAVVDVAGHGVRSTRTALDVTHALRTLSREGHPLGEVVARTDQLIEADDAATVLLARIDTVTGAVELAGGGHPPALVVRRDGSAEYVDAFGVPIGYPLAGSDGTSDAVLGVGDTLLLYTDGLIELDRDILAGLENLRVAPASGADLGLEDLLDHLLRTVGATGDLSDDTLLLGLRRVAGGSAPSGALPHAAVVRLTLTPTADSAGRARRALAEASRAWALSPSLHDAATLVVSELVANAAIHGGGSVKVALFRRPAGLRIEVTDSSPHTPYAHDPGPDAESGRGLFLVRTLASRWGASATETDKTMWAQLDEPAG